MNKRITIVSILILAITALIIGVSYAYWGRTLTQNNNNILTSSCLKTVFNETSEAINLDRIGPMTFEDSKTLEPYSFTLVNECNIDVKYYINLETFDNTTLDDYSLNFSVNNEKENQLYGARIMEKTLDNAKDSHMLTNGKLEINESKSFDIRLWLSNFYITNNNEKTWTGKVVINSLPFENVPAVLDVISERLDSDIASTINNIEVVEEKPSGEITTYNLEEQNTSDSEILGYIDNGTLKLYTENGRIALNDLGNSLTNLSGVEEVDLGIFDTTKLTKLVNSFESMPSLKRVDLSSIDSTRLVELVYTFRNSPNIEEVIGFEEMNLENVDTIAYAIPDTPYFKDLDLRKWNLKKIRDGVPFAGQYLENIIIDGNNFENFINPILLNSSAKYVSAKNIKIRDNSYLTYNNNALTKIDITNLNLENCTKLGALFMGANSLTEIIGLNTLDLSNIESIDCIFNGIKIKEIDLSGWDVSNVKNNQAFTNTIFEKVIIDNWDMRKLENIYIFLGNRTIKEVSMKNVKCKNLELIKGSDLQITTVDITNIELIEKENYSDLLSYTYNLENIIGFETLSFDNVTTVNAMFYRSGIKTLDLRGKNISKITVGEILWGSNVETIILDGLNFKNIDWRNFIGTNANSLKTVSLKNAIFNAPFNISYAAREVEYLDISNIDISAWNNLDCMFYFMTKLKNIIGLDTLNTSNITSMKGIFYNTTSLEDLSGISNWNVSNVLDFADSFSNTSAPITSDLFNNWNINKNATFTNMFNYTTVTSYPNWDGTWNYTGTFTPN